MSTVAPAPRRALLPGLAALAVAGCSPAAPGSAGALQYYLSSDPRSLDPALSTDVQTGEMTALLYDNLVQFDEAGQVVPGLAHAWEVSADGRTWTFRLRTDARFHDGRAVTARDVAASFRRLLAPGSRGRAWPLLPVAGAAAFADRAASDVAGLATPDDSTVVLTLEAPLNLFPKYLAMPATAIVPAGAGDSLGEHPVGSGPWRLVAWRHDDQLLFARHEAWWGGAPASDTLRVRIIPEPLTQAAEFESGRLSVVEIPFGETGRWERAGTYPLQRRPALRALYVALNTRRGILRDVRVRRAINHAVRADAMLEHMMQRRGVRAAGSIPPGLEGHDATRAPYAFDRARARQLLAEAGVAPGTALRLWRSPRPVFARLAQAIQQDLAAVGLAVEIVERDAASARAAARKGEADLFLTDWYGDYPDPENFLFPLFHSANAGTGGNYAFFADTTVDRRLEALRRTPDPATKARLARELDAALFAQAPWLYLWFPVDMWATRPGLEGWTIPAIFNGQRWRHAAQRAAP